MTASDQYNAAIDGYANTAQGLLTAGTSRVPAPSFPSNLTDPEVVARAQGYVSAGFSQLGQAAQMQSTQTGREGYAAVVGLMKTITTTTQTLCANLQSAINTADYNKSDAISRALTALAALAPTGVWSTPESST